LETFARPFITRNSYELYDASIPLVISMVETVVVNVVSVISVLGNSMHRYIATREGRSRTKGYPCSGI